MALLSPESREIAMKLICSQGQRMRVKMAILWQSPIVMKGDPALL